ncbi:MAG: mobile mystery protein B [Alphaproteobacteria bacterium]|jgi:Fic-DOC domain mobile mystery protein B|nr:mobile mystery protein B [Alphaproteobacteria bacterium]MBT7943038.1 mobile mystery protein B [Alphaproteobacteria bacterium]
MALEFETPEGSTPLEQEELEQLIPAHITTMGQLNEAEQLNVATASLWALSRHRSNVLTLSFARSLHKHMFNDVWRWAGEFRKRATNIGGVEAYEIPIRLSQLLDDTHHWKDDQVFDVDEIATRFHHGLTIVHPFPNGNGRHARLMADVLLKNMGEEAFTWGSGADSVNAGDVRVRYLTSLRNADNHDFAALMEFARS